MNFRIKTSKNTGEILKTLQSSTGLTWNILSRIAVGLSLSIPEVPEMVQDKSGVDIHRNAMTGEHDYVFKAIIRQHAQQNLTDEEYFPDYFNAHLERGIKLLENEYRHAGNYDKLLNNLFKIDA
ncbi:DNA sulfur modification protein DndE [Rossellomorea sp. YZS02]|uniref:DNA sulfur modification protein DndE n=1 Tax=Rossellomorea sp. YZS02 TaxID=3097358 RepID=UPI002A11702F|nr:DNA sulfur modification protein DndE [Rossellomorea sp. YZS02]MDX8344500.1 DNA sulfur modification protein DndE [Rossellomorea sp. YZS02]